MRNLLLLRRLIKVLFEEFQKRKKPIDRGQLVDYFTEKRRGWLLYRGDTQEEYRERIMNILGSHMPPKGIPREKREKYFVGYEDNGSENLRVTPKGMKFIDLLGLGETIWEEYKGWRMFVAWAISVIIVVNWRLIVEFFLEIF